MSALFPQEWRALRPDGGRGSESSSSSAIYFCSTSSTWYSSYNGSKEEYGTQHLFALDDAHFIPTSAVVPETLDGEQDDDIVMLNETSNSQKGTMAQKSVFD